MVSDLLGELLTAADAKNCVNILSVAYGRNFAAEMSEKIQLLFGMCLEKNWSGKRFEETTRWIIEHRPYRDWSISDFLTAPLRQLYPYSKYLSELHEKGKSFNTEIEWYDIGGTQLWAYKKDGELPFPKWQYKNPKNVSTASTPEPMPDEVRKTFEHLQSAPPRENKLRSLDELIPEEA